MEKNSNKKEMNIDTIATLHYEWLKEMGWTNKLSPLEHIALISSEIGEAANECRGEKAVWQAW
jgi:hypothetical protein